jgi:hypothetical protein
MYKLLNEEFERNNPGLTVVDDAFGPVMIISCSEMNSAITKTKSCKAARPPRVSQEMLRASGDQGVQWTTGIFNQIEQEGKISSNWKKSWIVNAYKGKRDTMEWILPQNKVA